MTKNARNSNIEFLRIFSMFLILLGHVFATRFNSEAQTSVVWYANTLFGTWSILGVDLFIVISAWFFSEQRFSVKRIIAVLVEAVSYIFAFGIFHAILACSSGFSLRLFFGSLFYFFVDNLFFEHHWFVIAYLALCLLFPFLNKLTEALQKRQLLTLVLSLSFVAFFSNIYGAGYYNVFGNVTNFCFVYLLTVYCKKYDPKIRPGLFVALLPALFVGFKTLTHYLPDNTFGHLANTLLSTTIANSRRYSLVMIFLALSIFLLVIKRPARSNTFVNAVARHVFGVYLFHETYFTYVSVPVIDKDGGTSVYESAASLKDLIVDALARRELLAPNIFLVVKLFAVSLLIFVVGIFFEWLRALLLQKPIMNLVTKKLGARLKKIDDRFHF